VHQLVTAYQANARSANSKQKGRSEIAKSTRKPFAQKGTGRARAGMASSPLWRGGGKIFPNSPDQNYTQKIKGMGLDRVLIITDSMDENLYLSSRNLPNVLVVDAHQADPVSLVRFPQVLVTKGAIAKIEEMLA
jgi:large subunit ribosomal protein L4